ncbi:MAG: RNA polymerase sigma factor, partial [Candidatus Limnocylindrales bacterium]
ISLAGMPDRDDAELARAATEDRAAFAAIYERHRTPVYRYLRARTTTDADAQDLTATTFERAMGAIHRFQQVGGGMVAWLIRIARNAHSDALRMQRRRGTDVASEGVEPAIDPSDDDVILRSLIDGLPGAQRDAIQLRFAAGLTAREIGGVLGISEAAAQKQVERGLQALKEAYGDD